MTSTVPDAERGARKMDGFPGRLRALMGDRGISGNELARQVPCDSALISRYLHGRQRPSAKMAARLDEVLNAGGKLAALAESASAEAGAAGDQAPLSVLLPLSFLPGRGSRPGLTVDGAEAVLARLYRIDAEMGGNELCAVVAGYLRDTAQAFAPASSQAGAGQRLHPGLGGPTAMAGWLSMS